MLHTFVPLTGPANIKPIHPFSFRAETFSDANHFMSIAFQKAVDEQLVFGAVFVETDPQPTCESIVEFQSNMTLEELRDILRSIQDSHVMLQTLRQVRGSENSFVRDWSIN